MNEVILFVGLATMIANLIVLAVNVKLFTEIVKRDVLKGNHGG